jgi:hypothetical protein
MADTQMARLITERRRRLVASIMGHAEREFYNVLTAQQQTDFRKKTLSAIDEFADLMRDVVKITSQDVLVNGHALELLEQIHDGQRRLVKRLD